MKILYGLAGEGMGHATRSKVIIKHLMARGHTVKIVASGRAYGMLAKSFPDVVEIVGLELRYVDGRVDLGGAILHNAQRLPAIVERARDVMHLVDRFKPDLIFSDFDSFAHTFGKSRNIPVISIDNLHMISRCEHDPKLLGESMSSLGPAEAFVSAKMPECAHYVIATFFHPKIVPQYKPTTTLVPSIVREEILAAKSSRGEHVLVYQTAVGDSRLISTLQSFPNQKFIVYGLGRDAILQNCVLKNFAERGFVNDLATCKAVVANGGMSLLGEAIYLNKPVHSVPIREHFEQCMNAAYLDALGYGTQANEFRAESLARFLSKVPMLTDRLKSVYRQHGNSETFDVVDTVMG